MQLSNTAPMINDELPATFSCADKVQKNNTLPNRMAFWDSIATLTGFYGPMISYTI